MKKLLCLWAPTNFTQHQKAECVRISKEILKLFNDGGFRFNFKIITVDETNITFLTFQHVKKVKWWTLKLSQNQQWWKRERAVMYAMFFRYTRLIKTIKREVQKTVTPNLNIPECFEKLFKSLMCPWFKITHHLLIQNWLHSKFLNR